MAIVAACAHGDPARAAAERFLDRHYVEIDLPKARDETVGLARAKIDEEMRLTDGQEAPEVESKPSVHYRLIERQQNPGSDRNGYLYEATISFDGGIQLKRRVFVTVRLEDGAWHVANFQETD